MFELRAGDVVAEIVPEHGGRLGQLTIDGRQLLAGTANDEPMLWGSYPMVPWSGRVRHGRFTFEGVDYQLPLGLPPHAIHGVAYLQQWDQIGPATIACDLSADWPFGGRAVQHFAVTPRSLTCVLEVHAGDRAMPAMVGWHPWFVRPDRFSFAAGRMYQRDPSGIPDGTSVAVPPGPWDDCFADVRQPIELTWGDLTVAVTSSCADWVFYDQPELTVCVEPQSGPPDAFTIAPEVVVPGRPMIHSFTISVVGPSI